MATILAIVKFILFAVLSLLLWGVVHSTLERFYLWRAQKFCRKRGLTVSRCRHGRCQESVLVELDCRDEGQRRLLVRLLVWIFGIREVLAIEDFRDEPPSHPPEGTKGLITLNEFAFNKKAWARDEGPVYTSKQRKRQLERHRLACPACGKSLIFDHICENIVRETGRCWACGAWVLNIGSGTAPWK